MTEKSEPYCVSSGKIDDTKVKYQDYKEKAHRKKWNWTKKNNREHTQIQKNTYTHTHARKTLNDKIQIEKI